MRILGISAYYHDSAAALVVDGRVVCAAQEERFSRKKHDERFPSRATAWCLSHAGLHAQQLDAIVFYDKPWLKFERLLESYYGTSPWGLQSFVTALPVWLQDKLFLKDRLRKQILELDPKAKQVPILFTEHHQAHAASAFYPSRFEEAALLTIDGVGEWATASIGLGQGNTIRFLRELHYPHSLGLLYSAFTYYLGLKVNSGEYKLMGLAPYGDPQSSQTAMFRKTILETLVDLKADGSLRLNLDYFTFTTSLRMVNDRRMERLLGIARREPETELTQTHANLALAVQQVTEEVVLRIANETRKLTGSTYLCMAGGVALNCVANGKLKAHNLFREIYIQPAAGDAGGALGAALAGYWLLSSQQRQPTAGYDSLQNALLGSSVQPEELTRLNEKYGARGQTLPGEEINRKVARLLAEGHIVGWVQGRMEWGPRALGNRSILGDPRRSDMQSRLNLAIKFREGFRPFAPAVLLEKATEWFALDTPAPYMLETAELQTALQQPLPSNLYNLPFADRLALARGPIPAVTHLDYSSRVQTVDRDNHPRFHALLAAFEELTGCPVLVNTSFNVRGEPIVRTAEEAYIAFMRTDMDAVVIEDTLFLKSEQPPWPEPRMTAEALQGTD